MSTYLDEYLTASSPVLRAMITAGQDDPAFLGNGGVMITTRVHDAMAAAAVTLDGEPVFNHCSWKPATGVPALETQSLHLGVGVFTETFTVPGGTATVETFALRQHANCAFQTLQLPTGDYAQAPAIPPNLIVDGGDHTYVHSRGVAIPCLRLRGYSRSDPCRRMAYLGAYLRADGVTWNGLDMTPELPAENKLTVVGPGVIHVLHCVAVGQDADAAVTRTAVAALTGANNNGAALRSGHTLRWASMWRASVVVTPKVPGDADVVKFNVALKAAQYRLLSTRRDAGRVTLAQAGKSWIKGDSAVAALLTVLPDCAKALALDAVVDATASAKALDPAAPRLDVLAGAILDVWNAFRVTLDRAWLRVASKEVYNAANVLLQRVEAAGLASINPTTLAVPLTSAGTVTSAFGAIVQDHGLTTHVVRQALSAATQIAFDLRDIPPADWLTAYNQLVVPRDGNTIRYSAASGTDPAGHNDQALVCHPYVFATPVSSVSPSAMLLAGKTTAELAVSDTDPTLRLGAIAVLATAAPLVTGLTNTAIAAAYAAIVNDVDSMSPLWRAMGRTPDADVQATSAFFSSVSYGFVRLRVFGVIDRDGTHVQRSRMEHEALVLLPANWAGVVVRQSWSGASAPLVRSISNNR
jgi:hypothetical protein